MPTYEENLEDRPVVYCDEDDACEQKCPHCEESFCPHSNPCLAKSIAALAEMEQRFKEERTAKRHFADRLSDLFFAGRAVAALQPAAYAKSQNEIDLWDAFYQALNNAPVGFPFYLPVAEPDPFKETK